MAGLPEAAEKAGSRADRGQTAEAWRGGSWEHGVTGSQRVLWYPSSSPCRCHLPKGRPGWDLAHSNLQPSQLPLYLPPEIPLGMCVGHTGPGSVCHREILEGPPSHARCLSTEQCPLVF